MESVPAFALAAFMVATGVAHVTCPEYFRRLVPSWVPAPSAVVILTGVCNVVAGALLTVPATRSAGGWATAALITAYLPAHLDGVRRMGAATRRYDAPVGIAARVLVNLGYIAWAVTVAVAQ